MTAIPPEVLIPQECPQEVFIPQVSLLIQEGILPIHLQGMLVGVSCMGIRSGSGLKVAVPEVNFKGG